MNYQQSIEWLFGQLPMYQRAGAIAYKADLRNILALVQHLSHPQLKFKSIHIAGTNGKGSTSHMLASVLQEAGYKVGLYTSPHLKDFRERIKVNGVMCPTDFVVDFVRDHQSFFKQQQLSFFEMTVGMAFDYFAKEKVDIAVIEVGLGGRLDSTNIITPELSVITNIGWDHVNILGDNLPAIAAEKAGIIKSNVPVIIGESLPETKAVFDQVAAQKNAPIHYAEETDFYHGALDLKGSYQQFNARTAISALKELQDQGWKIDESHIEQGLARVVQNTGLLGRYQLLSEQPKVICDTAHNREGLLLVMKQLQVENYRKLHIVLGMVSDKDLDAVLPLFPQTAQYYFCKPDVPRGLDAQVLSETAATHRLKGTHYTSVNEALAAAKTAAHKEDLIYIGGSTFVVAEVV